MKRSLGFVLTLFALLALAACSGSKAEGPKIVIENAWGRPSPKVATAGAFYMTIRNEGSEDDALIGADSDACGTIELHESYMKEGGAMGMRPVPGGKIVIPAGETVELKMGGLHIMCIDKQIDFQPGTKVKLILHFEKSGDIPIEVEIRNPMK
ncbi:MAG: copper chaperone PCu(A)C [Chloroflexi bacterium]|nr:copper chaperone PCu(A)C [Chloroflexota bacterium]